MNIKIKKVEKKVFNEVEIKEPVIGDILSALDKIPSVQVDLKGLLRVIIVLIQENGLFDGEKLRMDEIEALGMDFLLEAFSAFGNGSLLTDLMDSGEK